MARIDGRTLSHKTLEHIRIHCVRRIRVDGEKASVVMASQGLCRTTCYRWLKEYDRVGEEALREKIAPGRPPKLTDEQAQWVRGWILGKDPRQYGFDFGLWTRKTVQVLILEKLGIALGLTAVGRLLATLNITPQKPLRRAYERNPDLVEQWRNIIFPKLKARANAAGAKIFFLDEAGFQSDAPLGRTYGLRGKTPVVKTSGQRQSIHVISAVNARGEFWAATYSGKLDAESFVQFLKDFMKGRKKNVMLVVDGHPAHKANLVKEYIAQLKGRLELHFLPPYAPDLNPDEFVWSYMKNNGVSKRPLKRNESMRSRIEEDLRAIYGNPRLVRAFFGEASVAYAKD